MNIWRKLFPIRERVVKVYATTYMEPGWSKDSILTFPPNLSCRPGHPREYVRVMHLKAKSWKRRKRNSTQYAFARAEARLAEWTYHTWRHGVALDLLKLQVKNYPKGWPYYVRSEWEKAADLLYKHFSNYQGPR